jgi:hypothetical protein
LSRRARFVLDTRSSRSQSFQVKPSGIIDAGYLPEVEIKGEELMFESVATRALQAFEIGG